MLVLRRLLNERVIIAAGTPYETVIEVVDIRGQCVRLGVDAGKNVTIHREEVQKLIDSQQNELAEEGKPSERIKNR